MKTKQLLATALAAVAMMGSCKNDDYRLETPNKNEVNFTSSINGQTSTRLTGNTWDSNDAIGVFMKQGAGLTNVLAANKRYVTATGSGNFFGQGSDVINYPETGNVDFIAYYPYTTSLNGNALPINVATQTNQGAIDVLYSNNATNLSNQSGAANLVFTHKLAKVELNVRAGNGVANVNGLAVAYKNVNSTASLDLATGTISGATASQDVSSKVTAQTNAQLVETILIPANLSGKEIVFTLPSGTYTWTLPTAANYESGKKYAYDIVLQTEDATNTVVVEGVATITDWTSVPSGNVNVKIDDDGGTTPNPGTGTEQTFYLETFGEAGPTTGTRARVGAYLDYDVASVTYSDLFTTEYVDIRSTNGLNTSGNGTHVWFAATRITGLKISGINATGYSDIKLSYDLGGQSAAASTIKVRVNGTELTVPSLTLPSNDTQYSTITIENITPANTLNVEFEHQGTDKGFRLDNIKLVGKK